MADIARSNGYRQPFTLGGLAASGKPTLTLPSGAAADGRATATPGGGFTGSGLPGRARALMCLLDGISQATKVLEAADRGLRGLTALVEQAQDAARQALQSPSGTPRVSGANTTPLSPETLLHSAGAGGFAPGDTVTVNGATVLTLAAGDGVDDLVDGINANAQLNPLGAPRRVQASLNARGQIVVEALDGAALAVSGSEPARVSQLFGRASLQAEASFNPVRQVFAVEFEAIRGRIGSLAAEAGYQGINLLDGALLRVPSGAGGAAASLSLTGVRFDARGLAIPAPANRWQSDRDIHHALDGVAGALTRLREQATVFASNLSAVRERQDFTAGVIDSTASGEGVSDETQSEEAARLMVLHMRQQLAATASSLATQSEQSVLRLF